jgi:hypothetical protein
VARDVSPEDNPLNRIVFVSVVLAGGMTLKIPECHP